MNDAATGNEKAIDLEWENRVLCSDESCIGVIGPDGRCKECGKAYEGELPAADTAVAESADEVKATVEESAADETPRQPEPPSSAPAFDDDWDNRTLCSDGNCIGVIGPDGICKECGRPYAG